MSSELRQRETGGATSAFGIIAYALCFWPLGISQLAVAFVAPYYSATVGFSLAFVGAALTAGRIVDVVADVSVAWLSDRTSSRWGRRKPFVTVGLILYIPATIILFIPPHGITKWGYGLSVLLFFVTWTIAFIPFLAQGTELSSDYRVKDRINAIQSGIALVSLLLGFTVPFLLLDSKSAPLRRVVASLLPSWLPSHLLSLLNHGPIAGGAYYGGSMRIITALALWPVVAILPLYLLKVPGRREVVHSHEASIFHALRNPVFIRLISGNVLLMSAHMTRGFLPFVLTYALKLPNVFLFYMVITYIVSILSTPVWSRLMHIWGRLRCVMCAAALEAVSMAMLLILPAGDVALGTTAFIVMGLSGQTMLMVPYLLAADSADYSALKTKVDSRAVHISLCSLSSKIGAVVASGWIFVAGLAGFDGAKAIQTDHVILVIKLIGLVLPIVLLSAGCFVLLGFPIDRRRHGIIQRRLMQRADRELLKSSH